jgi:hypothetical protein
LFDLSYRGFYVGDIVQEHDLFTYFENERMTGMVIEIEKNYYSFFQSLPQEQQIIQDKVKVYWFSYGFMEELSGDLLVLVSRAENEREKI